MRVVERLSYDRVTANEIPTVERGYREIHCCFCNRIIHSLRVHTGAQKSAPGFLRLEHRSGGSLCDRHGARCSHGLLGVLHPIHATLHAGNGVFRYRDVYRDIRRELAYSSKTLACAQAAFHLRVHSLPWAYLLLRTHVCGAIRECGPRANRRLRRQPAYLFGRIGHPRDAFACARYHVAHVCKSPYESFNMETGAEVIVCIFRAYRRSSGNNSCASCTFGQHAGTRGCKRMGQPILHIYDIKDSP